MLLSKGKRVNFLDDILTSSTVQPVHFLNLAALCCLTVFHLGMPAKLFGGSLHLWCPMPRAFAHVTLSLTPLTCNAPSLCMELHKSCLMGSSTDRLIQRKLENPPRAIPTI